MAEIRIKKRRRLRSKDIRALAAEIKEKTGRDSFTVEDLVDGGSSSEFDVVFVDGEIRALVIDGKAFLTIRGILKYGADSGFITVDMGAVSYVANGADIMAPGVVGADPDVEENDLVWIRDERNQRPLAIGMAIMSGPAMVEATSGKAVKTIHYVGDRLWKYDES